MMSAMQFGDISTCRASPAQRNGAQLSPLLMEIGSFRSYNDFFGHQRRDGCLVTVA